MRNSSGRDENFVVPTRGCDNFRRMSASYLRLTKSETRELADREYRARYSRASEWQMSNGGFFAAFVVIAAVLAVIALVLR